MAMQMIQELRQVLRQSQKQRLALEQHLAHDFKGFIDLQDSGDLNLLDECLPFLVLHEVAHPLHSRGDVNIPKIKPSQQLYGRISELGYQMAVETGIDKAAMIIGEMIGYTKQDMIQANAAITQRVFRDVFDLQKVPFGEGFIARLHGELKIHKTAGMTRSLYDRVTRLEEKAEKEVKDRLLGKTYGVYSDLVSAYARVYRGTTVTPQKGSIARGHHHFSLLMN